ncbi:MAG: hypothetical protein WDZ69_00490 [Candidatus Pacearchaeota archaeon]
MEWYNYLIILGIVIGLLFSIFGSYHGYAGKSKTGVWGIMIIFTFLIIKALIWLLEMF